MRSRDAIVLAVLALGMRPTPAAAIDHFTCYQTRAAPGAVPFATRSGVSVVDGYGTSSVDVRKTRLLCAPTDMNGSDPSAPSHPEHLAANQIRRAGAFRKIRSQTVHDQFGDHVLDLAKPLGLAVPSTASASAPPLPPAAPASDHFQCYQARTAKGTARFTPRFGVTLDDQFGGMTVDVMKPRRLCVPADKNGEAPGAETHPDALLCYQIRQANLPRFAGRTPVYAANQFGGETLSMRKPRELCVGATRPAATPTPLVTPTRTATIAATPPPGATATPTLVPTPTATATPLELQVGAAARTLNPSVAEAPPDGQVYLGGFGLGASRRSTGVLGSGAWVRAFVVENGVAAIALVEYDNQGAFAAYELTHTQAGSIDIARAVEAARPALHADHIVIAADHSHAGQDLVGVWGGVPNEYLAFVKAQAVAAIVEAYDTRELANVAIGTVGGITPADASPILTSQFDDSSCTPAPTAEDPGHTTEPCTEEGDYPDWDLVDASVRVLHATRKSDATTIATLVNFAAHSTVMGSGNTLISSDWPGPTAEKVEAALGGRAVVMPAANGRTQPERPSGTDPEKLDAYSSTIADIVLQAVAAAVPIQGDTVGAKKRLILETADNAGLLALNFAGQAGCFVDPAACVPIMRANTPPWLNGNVIGTVVSALRVGNVLFSGAPGEPYPQVAFGIQHAVDAGPPGTGDISHHFIFSLADDQLGYLIAPAEGLPAAAEKTAIDGNDNALFNIAATLGDHVMCSAIDLALDIGFAGDALTDPRCAAWTAEPDLNPVTQLPN